MMTAATLLSAWHFRPAMPATALDEELTLCEINSPFEPQLIIGTVGITTYSSSLPVQYYNFLRIQINGTFIIDSPLFYILNSKVQISPGGQIIVNGGKKFTGFKSQFFTCGGMWEGIQLLESAQLRLAGCTVEDAMYAIDVKNQAVVGLTDNLFNRNVVGIRMRPDDPLAANTINFSLFKNNTFTCTSVLNIYNDDVEPPGYYDISHAGIDVTDCTLVIGDPLAPNTFTGALHYGITAQRAQIFVRNCRFMDLEDLEGSHQSYFDGIYTKGGSLTVTWGGTENTRSIFHNSGIRGIHTEGTSLTVEHCDFTGNNTEGTTAIHSFDNFASEKIRIAHNTISSADWGSSKIMVRRPIASSGLSTEIYDNHFDDYSSAGFGRGIFLIGLGASSQSQALIHHNVMTQGENNPISYGIVVWNLAENNAIVRYNKVEFAEIASVEDVGSIGIHFFLSYGEGNEIYTNNIKGSSNSLTHLRAQAAIRVSASPKLTVCGNTMSDTQVGVRYFGENQDAIFSTNTMGRHDIGLWVDGETSTAGIGTQVRTDNRWSEDPDDYLLWAARCDAPFQNSLFIVQSSDPGIIPDPVSPMSGWFESETGPMNYCPGASISQFTDAEQMLMADEIQLTELREWEMKRLLLLKLALHPEAMPAQSAEAAYYAAQAGTSAGRLAHAEGMMLNALRIPDTIHQALTALHETRSILIDSIFSIEDDLLEQPVSDTSLHEALATAKAPLLDELEDLRILERQLKAGLYALRAPLLQDAKDYNEATTVSETWESSRKTLNDYFIRQVLGETLSSDYQTLLSVAMQTPKFDGDAVYHARGYILDPELQELWLEGWTLPEGPQARYTLPPTTPEGMRLWPNPAEGRVNLKIPAEQPGTISAFSILGRKMFERIQSLEGDTGVLEIPVEGWPSGLYYCVFRPGHGAPLSLPFVIR
ncbi:MAG: hypothetical protein KF852_14735 [Saprospiraceae bacterium]|nr:hypothetical protein [Saprospiraceae bacterium]